MNPTPTWQPVTLPDGWGTTVLDFSAYPGSQLCWRADIGPQLPECRMVIHNVDVGYELTPMP